MKLGRVRTVDEPNTISVELLHDEIVRIALAAHSLDKTFNDFVIDAVVAEADKLLERAQTRQKHE